MMLAYVFWHWRQPSVSPEEYESLQRDFHETLAREPSPGFLRSFSYAVTGAPWANAGGEAYADWYLLEGAAALDPLNEAAVTAARERPHHEAAAVAGGGTAGIYRLRAGTAVRRPLVAIWFSRPAGTTYRDLLASLAPALEQGDCGLWIRQMTLGPAAECCLLGEHVVELPSPLAGITLALRPVWPVEGVRA